MGKNDGSWKGFTMMIVVIVLLLALFMVLATRKGVGPLRQRSPILVPSGISRSDLVVIGRSIRLDGQVTGSVVAIMGDTYVTGGVDRDIVVLGGTAVLMSSAVVAGDVVVIGGNLQLADGAHVGGRTVSLELPQISWPQWRTKVPLWFGRGFSLPWTLHWDLRMHRSLKLLSGLLLGWLVIALLPGNIANMVDALGSNWVRFTLVGIMSYSVAIVLIILAFVTIVGIPLSLLLVLGLAVVRLLAQVTVGVFVGQMLLDRLSSQQISQSAALLVGLLILSMLETIPGLNIIIKTLAALAGVGVVVGTRCGSGRNRFWPQV